eukprot:sb/3478339/
MVRSKFVLISRRLIRTTPMISLFCRLSRFQLFSRFFILLKSAALSHRAIILLFGVAAFANLFLRVACRVFSQNLVDERGVPPGPLVRYRKFPILSRSLVMN